MANTKRGVGTLLAVAVIAVLLSSCTVLDVAKLAGDETAGRNNATPGSTLARQYLLDQLKPIAQGADSTRTGDDAYLQSFPNGTNVVAVIRGTDLADQYVMVGAHYDHLGNACRSADPNDAICNGATDNAAGAAALLAIGRSIAGQSTPPRRSIILALWDREEDGLLGSSYYTQHPLIPLAKTVAYVNFDIQGSNLLPSLRNTSFAIASESGGARLQQAVQSAISQQTLDDTMFSTIFGQGRSDYVPFIGAQVPSVFFTDATGPCYHTAQDQIGIVDFEKLDQQIAIALRVTRDLATANTNPVFVSGSPVATFDDALSFGRTMDRLWADLQHFSSADQDTLTRVRDDIKRIVAEGRAAFGDDDVGTLLGDAASTVSILTHGACDGFLVHP